VPDRAGPWDATSPENVARLLDGTHAHWNTRITASKNPGESSCTSVLQPTGHDDTMGFMVFGQT